MNLNGMAKSTLQSSLKPEEALLCAMLTNVWVRKASLWEGPTQYTTPPTHEYGWDSQSPFGSSYAAAGTVAGASSGDDASLLSVACDAVFTDWDLDGHGKLSVRELSVKLQELGLPSSIEQLHAFVRELDGDGDGRTPLGLGISLVDTPHGMSDHLPCAPRDSQLAQVWSPRT